ncbi:aminotransferase class I/II-fold pyridoxal phosphate-dependent enzyme, partial [Candidatus Heimdallarchaeota archaeon]
MLVLIGRKQMSNNISITGSALERNKKHQEIAEKYDLALDQIIDLSLGDNLFIPPSLIQDLVVKNIESIDPRDSYPADYFMFLDEISRFIGVETQSLYPGLTHNQLIQRVLSTITKPRDNVILITPDKDIFSTITKSHKLKINKVSLLDDFELDVNAILECIDTNSSKAIIFTSPHYPTANQFQENDVLTLAKETKIPIVIDESYVEFGKYSLVNQVQYFDNLIIVRSFSKAWGLGSLSCAYLVADSKIINLLKDKYFIEEIPPIHAIATKHILQSPYKFVELINTFNLEKKRIQNQLKMLNGLKVFKSDTNFLFIRYKNDMKELYEQLCSKGIIVQTFDEKHKFKDYN